MNKGTGGPLDARRRAAVTTLRQVCWVVCILLAYVLQTAPGFLKIFGVKPVLLVPLALCIAIREGIFAGSLYGAFAGLMWDLAAGRTAGGFALLLMGLCFLIALAVEGFLRGNVLNLSIAALIAMLLMTGIDFLLTYVLRGYTGTGTLYLTRTLPTCFYSALLTFIPYYLTKLIAKKLEWNDEP